MKKPPPARKFQNPLPEPSSKLVSTILLKLDLNNLMDEIQNDHQFIRLAYQCASTFRATDYAGGCNGARIRYSPGRDWPINAGLSDTIKLLDRIKLKYDKSILSYSDLIVLAGNVAVERIGSPKLTFCPGRTDDDNGDAWKQIEYGNTDHPTSVDQLIELMHRRGQSYQDWVALTFIHFNGSVLKLRSALTTTPATTPATTTTKSSSSKENLIVQAIKYYPEYRHWAERIASGTDEVYGAMFAEAWTRLMNADRFDGPVGNICG
jgi:catalase-peroxidase